VVTEANFCILLIYCLVYVSKRVGW